MINKSITKKQLRSSSFIRITQIILSNPAYFDIISRSEDGSSIIIKQKLKLQEQVLPIFFKHNKYKSFLRQLNKYGFKQKLIEGDIAEFHNPNFNSQSLSLKTTTQQSTTIEEYILEHRHQQVALENLRQQQYNLQTQIQYALDDNKKLQQSFIKNLQTLTQLKKQAQGRWKIFTPFMRTILNGLCFTSQNSFRYFLEIVMPSKRLEQPSLLFVNQIAQLYDFPGTLDIQLEDHDFGGIQWNEQDSYSQQFRL